MPSVEHHFDFGSPNAYLAHLVIPEIEARTGVAFEYVPILLGGVFKLTNNKPPLQSLAGIRNKPEYERLEMERFLRRHGITRFRFNPHFPVNTLGLMRGAIAARDLGVFDRYLDEIFRHMWAEPKKLDDPEVCARALENPSRRRNAARARAEPDVKHASSRTEASVARGTFGAPTFRDARSGSEDRLRDVERRFCVPRIAARLRSASPRCALRLPAQLGFGGNCARISSTALSTRLVTSSGFGSSFSRPPPKPRHPSLRLGTSLPSIASVPSS